MPLIFDFTPEIPEKRYIKKTKHRNDKSDIHVVFTNISHQRRSYCASHN